MRLSIGEWEKLDIRIGTVTAAERVEGADKLLKLNVDLGPESRQIIAGVALWYAPEELVGKQIPILTNLEAKTFRGLTSDGMMLAASDGPNAVLLHPEKDVPAGSKVR